MISSDLSVKGKGMSTVNYTEEQTKQLVELYLEGKDREGITDELAEIFGKPKRSIIGKLSKEGVYEKKVYKTKQGTSPITKKEMIHKMSIIMGADAEKLQGLEKAPKMDLAYLAECLRTYHDKILEEYGYDKKD